MPISYKGSGTMLLAVCHTKDSGGASIAEKLARRLDIPCCVTETFAKVPVLGPCVLLEEQGHRISADMDGLVRVLIHRGKYVSSAGYDLAVGSGPLGEEATMELLSQFVALKVMPLRTRRTPTGGRTL